MKQIQICALGPLHVSGYLARAGLIKEVCAPARELKVAC